MRQHLSPVSKIVKHGDDLYLASQRPIPLHNNLIGLEDDHFIMILLIRSSNNFAYAFGHRQIHPEETVNRFAHPLAIIDGKESSSEAFAAGRNTSCFFKKSGR